MALIMVLDDERDACRLMQRILSRLGHRVQAFCRADEARRWLETSQPDLAVLDIKLKEDNGLSVLKFLRTHRPSVKVIMITGYPSAQTTQEALRLGVEDYLIKPVEIEDLESRVDKALEKRSVPG
ncbi:MAG: response regulator [Desulfosoma sp.]